MTLKQLLQQTTASGQILRVQNHLNSIFVGRLDDPNDASIKWCVRERGTSSISYVDRSSGKVIRQQSVTFDDKFWLVMVGGPSLIVDVEVSSSSPGGA